MSARVSIPNNVRKTIQNIKEITGDYSEDEIYVMLKECSMDPNETAQKLLSQDPFHEVKRKRDRKKEIVNKESTESRFKPRMQARGNRSSRYISNGGGKTSLSAKENVINQGASSSGAVPDGSSDKKQSNKAPTGAVGSGNTSASKTPSPSPRICLSDSDPILLPSQESRFPLGAVRCEVRSQQTPVEEIHKTPLEIKSTAFGPSMEWKPKPTNPILESVKVPVIPVKVQTPTVSASSNLDSKDVTHVLEKKLEESHISDDQHVIISDHLHVPEAEKLGFYFGSFDASFDFNASSSNGPVSDKGSEASVVVDDSIEEQQPRNQNALATSDEGDNSDRPSSSSNIPENLSAKRDDAMSDPPTEYIESKQETLLPTASHQYPFVHSSPNFSFGFVPPMIGTHLTSFENNESSGRDGSYLPNFVVQQPFDLASYYAQFNGNVPVLSQEVGNALMLSTTGPTSTSTTQTGNAIQSSIAVTQQPLPVFRHLTGVHLPHYPLTYLPYGPYFPPFYVPPQAIHQFLSNGTFPQQPVASPKYPIPQYKPGNNTGNHPAHIGMHGNYGPYGSNPAGYNSGSANTAGNSTSSEDLGGSQFKESSLYITGQQSEGTGVWIGQPGRDMSGLPANSFYNLPQSGQLAYTLTQSPHGPFASIYHPTQPITTATVHPLLQQSQTPDGTGVDMVGPTSQINWPNNY